jgi:hypothetical protein
MDVMSLSEAGEAMPFGHDSRRFMAEQGRPEKARGLV